MGATNSYAIKYGAKVIGTLNLLDDPRRHLEFNVEGGPEAIVAQMRAAIGKYSSAAAKQSLGVTKESLDEQEISLRIAAAVLIMMKKGRFINSDGPSHVVVCGIHEFAEWRTKMWGCYADAVKVPMCYKITRGDILAVLGKGNK